MQLTKKNITELSKIKSSFIQFLEENEFKEHKSSKNNYIYYKNNTVYLSVDIQISSIKQQEIIMLKVFNNEWGNSFQPNEIEDLKRIITHLIQYVKNHP
jgi:hypothetical protein